VTRQELGDLALNVEVAGSGPPLLLLHGFTGSIHTWDGVRPALNAFATSVCVDLIGHGDSDAPADAARYTQELAVRDLLHLLDVLGFASVNLLGYSMGGRLALLFALEEPARVRTLILESASPGIHDPVERARRRASDDALAQRIESASVDAFVADWEAQPLLQLAPHVAPAVRQRQHAQRLRNSAVGLANSLRGMGAGQQAPLWSRLGELSLPVQLIVGQHDARYCAIARRLHAAIPHATLSICQDAGHTVHLERPDAFAAALTTFLQERERAVRLA
jgi:2-succinyl-6-hydroxy-2,4-cyclohexadiene-1-carboxylate synthase